MLLTQPFVFSTEKTIVDSVCNGIPLAHFRKCFSSDTKSEPVSFSVETLSNSLNLVNTTPNNRAENEDAPSKMTWQRPDIVTPCKEDAVT